MGIEVPPLENSRFGAKIANFVAVIFGTDGFIDNTEFLKDGVSEFICRIVSI